MQPDPANLTVALAYQEEDGAPRVVAKGRGLLAQAIIERARDAGVYVHESPELVALLMQVDLDQRIPPQLYVEWPSCSPGCIASSAARICRRPPERPGLRREGPTQGPAVAHESSRSPAG
jgi:flagellar biosynthesis protein